MKSLYTKYDIEFLTSLLSENCQIYINDVKVHTVCLVANNGYTYPPQALAYLQAKTYISFNREDKDQKYKDVVRIPLFNFLNTIYSEHKGTTEFVVSYRKRKYTFVFKKVEYTTMNWLQLSKLGAV